MSLDLCMILCNFQTSLFIQAVYLYYCIFVFLVCKNLRIDAVFFITCNYRLQPNFGGMQSPFEISHICICLLEKKKKKLYGNTLEWDYSLLFLLVFFFGPFTKAPINNSFHVWKDQMQMFIQLLGNHQNRVMHFKGEHHWVVKSLHQFTFLGGKFSGLMTQM